MKQIYIGFILLLFMIQYSYAQSFEIRIVNKGGGDLGVEMRETSGTGTPTTSNLVTDIKFGIKWLQSYGSGLDLNSSITTSYNILKSGSRASSGVYYFQSFYANSTPFNFPTNWTQNIWVEIMSISNNLGGNSGTGTFEICEYNFDPSTNPNIGVNLTDYTPTINGQADNVPLPVELTSFTAFINQNTVSLKWQTATELNNYGFDVERKSQTESWIKIGFVPGHGNSSSIKSYGFTDNNISGGGKLQYRLKQIDNDGTFEYSDVAEVNIASPENYALEQNYPNPFNPATTISYSIPSTSHVRLSVFNILGQEIAVLINEVREAGINSVSFSGADLAGGVYFYRLSTENFTQIKKMLLVK